MGLTATEGGGGGDFEMTPAGQYIARCYRIIDLGTQTKTNSFGTKQVHQVSISWELIGPNDARMEDGRPFSAHKTYTVTLSEKGALRPDLEAWRGKPFTTQELEGFDLSTILGKYCMMQIVHDPTGKYANVQTIMSYMGDKPDPVNENILFDIDKPDMAVFEKLSDNMKAKIVSSPEWQKNQPKLAPASSKPVAPVANKPAPKSVDEVTLEDVEGEPIPLDDIPF